MVKEYFLAPHFDAPAPPRGLIKLGTVLSNLWQFSPYVLNLHSDHRPLTERALGLIGRGPRAPSRRPEGEYTVISCEHLDTLGFTPTESYVKDTIENLDDECLKPSSRSKRPVYMVTGLKIARGAKYSSRVSSRAVVGRDFSLPRNPLVSLAVSFGHHSESVMESSWSSLVDFIVAFKVVQVWINHKGEVKFEEYNKKAVMEFEPSSE
ncbi:major facilitator superfamily MFS-1 [Fusarium tjaetaba]|uniref:Major facilitator superfamily MFS-1 n=1 Tax=Fusarium tjaetaba TaxID=1567544 RepID=A0A8H5R5B6_9HYPO|nr:major facilitator superfamily MFS-1 [Fusarium tjaetaba]KAF5626834.1 major facilitator superfamily MFS-1 [Fusarium tjaetaba]